MRKGLLYWGAIALGVILVVTGFLFFGREPEVRDVLVAIPQPDRETPYVLLTAEGGALPAELSRDKALSKVEGMEKVVEAFASVRPILSSAERIALMARMKNNAFSAMASLSMPRSILESLERGRLPDSWGENLSDAKLERTGTEERLKLTLPDLPTPIYLGINGGLVLLSPEIEELESMMAVLDGRGRSVSAEWSLKPGWSGHVRLYDAGLASRTALLQKLPVSQGDLFVEGAWREDAGVGEFLWKITGLEDILSQEVFEKFQPCRWRDKFLLADPLIMTVGMNVPELSVDEVEALGLTGIGDEFGLSKEDILGLIGGPWTLSVGGKSKILVLSFPGIMLQLPDRGDLGEKVVDSFWNTKWSDLRPPVTPINGFSHGGAATVPFTITAMASKELAILGVIDPLTLSDGEKVVESIPLLDNGGDALFWFYVDAPRLAEALRGLANAGRMAGKLGNDIGDDIDRLSEMAGVLDGLGQVSISIPSLIRGSIRWTSPKDVQAVK